MNRYIFLLAFFLSVATFTLKAQIRAVTDDGTPVLLYPDGTWQYDRGERGFDRGRDSRRGLERGHVSNSMEISFNNEIVFVLKGGRLHDFLILDRYDVVYSRSRGVHLLPYDWQLDRELGSGRVSQIGPYRIEYEPFSDRITKVGKYRVEYETFEDTVKRIGGLSIEYDFFSGKLKRIGNVRIEYDFFSGHVKSISGDNPGVTIRFF